jgi:hypothetical protein
MSHLVKKILVIYSILSGFGFYSFAGSSADSSVNSNIDTIIYTWKVNNHNYDLNKSSIDTFLHGSQVYNPIYKDGVFAANMGNMAGPATSHYFFDERFANFRFFYLNPYRAHLFHPASQKYFNTKKPFSNLEYITGFSSRDKLTQTISILHTQNINKKTNVGLNYKLRSARGFYANQKNNIGTFSLFSSYNGRIYSIHGNLNINSIESRKNGGINTQNFLLEDKDTKAYPTNLTSVTSFLRNRGLFFTQKIHIGTRKKNRTPTDSTLNSDTLSSPIINDSTSFDPLENKSTLELIHNFRYHKNDRRYVDENANENIIFYDSAFNNMFNYDSAYYRDLENTFALKLNELNLKSFSFGALIGLEHHFEKYAYLNHLFDTAKQDTFINKNMQNTYVKAHFFNKQSQYINYAISGKYCIDGYYGEDMELSGMLSVNFDKHANNAIQFTGHYSSKKPDYLYNNYASNFINYNASLQKLNTANAKIRLTNKKIHLSTGVDYQLHDNYIYFDTTLLPQQLTKTAGIMSAYIKKDFHFWKITSRFRVAYQKTDNDFIRLPELSIYNSTYLTQIVNFRNTGGKIKFILGFDVYYFTPYFVYSYYPVLNQFYVNDVKKYGNYPYFNAYLNAKIKRMNVFFKAQHLSEGVKNKQYFTINNHPMSPRRFMLGISWNFYN